MDKRQWKALLNIISNDKSKPALCGLYSEDDGKTWWGTNGYTAVEITVEGAKVGKKKWFINRDMIEQRVKQMDARKGVMGIDEVPAIDGEYVPYPDITIIISPLKEPVELSSIIINPNFLVDIDLLVGEMVSGVEMKFYGKNSPVIIEQMMESMYAKVKGIVMPKKGA